MLHNVSRADEAVSEKNDKIGGPFLLSFRILGWNDQKVQPKQREQLYVEGN
jgi:hypothetical protein